MPCFVITGPVGVGSIVAENNTKTPEAINATVVMIVTAVFELFFCVGSMCGGFDFAFCRYDKPHDEIEQEPRARAYNERDEDNTWNNRVNIEVIGKASADTCDFSV